MESIWQRLLHKMGFHLPVVTPDCPNLRIYCIGDIHGRLDLLQQIHTLIVADAEAINTEKTIVYLGDYIDRGMDSKPVIDELLTFPLPGFNKIYLRGNHEQVFLDFLQHPEVVNSWIQFGGQMTFSSYGVPLTKIPACMDDYLELQTRLKQNIPASHIEFMNNTLFDYSYGHYYFVHAGIHPRIKLEAQNNHDKLWIRDNFINCNKNYEKIIVHGHTVFSTPQILVNRIGIDTGGYISNTLTCLVLENESQKIIQATS